MTLKPKAEATGDIEIGGPTLAAAALHAGLVDQFALFTVPVVIGGGNPVFPPGLKTGLGPHGSAALR